MEQFGVPFIRVDLTLAEVTAALVLSNVLNFQLFFSTLTIFFFHRNEEDMIGFDVSMLI